MVSLASSILLAVDVAGGDINYPFEFGKILLQAICTAGLGWFVAIQIKRMWYDVERNKNVTREEQMLGRELADMEQHFIDNQNVLRSILEPEGCAALDRGRPSSVHFAMLKTSTDSRIFLADTLRSMDPGNAAMLHDLRVRLRNENILADRMAAYVDSPGCSKRVLLDYMGLALKRCEGMRQMVCMYRGRLGNTDSVEDRRERLRIVHEEWPPSLFSPLREFPVSEAASMPSFGVVAGWPKDVPSPAGQRPGDPLPPGGGATGT